ncbi:MAG: hypothetical protein IH625_01520, partial [Rhodobacteraceae bacterium]|nr:hypothetical protein [Paracoccaceae bacterium]
AEPAFPADPGLTPANAEGPVADPQETVALAEPAAEAAAPDDGPAKPRRKGWWALGR